MSGLLVGFAGILLLFLFMQRSGILTNKYYSNPQAVNMNEYKGEIAIWEHAFKDSGIEISLYSPKDKKLYKISCKADEQLKIPVGEYEMVTFALTKIDADNINWQLVHYFNPKETKIKFTTTETKYLNLTNPITAEVSAQIRGENISLQPKIADANENNFAVFVIDERAETVPAKFQIVDENEQVILADTFSYG